MRKTSLAAIAMLLAGLACFAGFHLAGATVGPDGMLHEPFALLPLGCLLLLGALLTAGGGWWMRRSRRERD